MPFEVFISYAHKGRKLRDELAVRHPDAYQYILWVQANSQEKCVNNERP